MAANTSLILCLLVISVAALVDSASTSEHHAPAPAPDCASLIPNMATCLPFVSNGSTTTKPEGSCCSGLKTVLKSNPYCLCQAFKDSGQFGVVLNITKAIALPAACKLSAPPISNCGLSETPIAAPASAPGMAGTASHASPAAAPIPSPGNSSPPVLPISAGSFLACMVLAIFSGF